MENSIGIFCTFFLIIFKIGKDKRRKKKYEIPIQNLIGIFIEQSFIFKQSLEVLLYKISSKQF